MAGQNDFPTESVFGQTSVILAGHWPLTGSYFEPCLSRGEDKLHWLRLALCVLGKKKEKQKNKKTAENSLERRLDTSRPARQVSREGIVGP